MFRRVVERLKTLRIYDTPVGKIKLLKTNLIGQPKDIELVLPDGSSYRKLHMSPGAGAYAEVSGQNVSIFRERDGYVISLPEV